MTKLKVFLITQEEPFYIPKMVKYLIGNSGEKYNIIGASILPPHRKSKNYYHWFKERSRVYNLKELMMSGFGFLFTKFHNKLSPSSSNYSVKNTLRKFKINQINSNDINSNEFISKLSELNPDVIISISCPQLFKEDLLNVPNKYSINAHGTLLPRHRGVFGSWWTLFSGDNIGGSTIHTMELKLDAGEVLWQREFPVEKNDTQYSIAYKTKRDMAIGLVETLNKIDEGKEKPIKPEYQTSYHRAPTKEQGKEFHKKGYNIFKVKDFKYILSKSF